MENDIRTRSWPKVGWTKLGVEFPIASPGRQVREGDEVLCGVGISDL